MESHSRRHRRERRVRSSRPSATRPLPADARLPPVDEARVLVIGGNPSLKEHYWEAPQGIVVSVLAVDDPFLLAHVDHADAVVVVFDSGVGGDARVVRGLQADVARSIVRALDLPILFARDASLRAVREAIASAYLATMQDEMPADADA